MLLPRDVFDKSAAELREIVWWNEKLTKLSQVADTSHLDEMLVETDGPYIEKVSPPAYYKIPDLIPWSDFAYRWEISKEVKDATTTVLFKGEENLPLYHHQGEAICYLCRKATKSGKPKDVVLSVPTATGKTEAFLIPILDYCVTRRKEQQRFEGKKPLYNLKALIIYPMKTLEVDQLNRFVEYLYHINQALEAEGWAPIRIGIWDGDTPTGVSDVADLWGEDYDSYGIFVRKMDGARGLKCPIHERESLVYYDESKLECPKGHHFDWILMTRQGIKSGVDILITNPEALSHLLISPENKKVVLSDDVKYIVVDEAHTWKGVSGSVFSVFLRRLRSLYEASNPQIVLSSATIRHPEQFGRRLLHVNSIQTIKYRTYLDIINAKRIAKKADFQRIPHTRFDYSMLVLLGAEYVSENEQNLSDYLLKTKHLIPDKKFVANSIEMLQLLNLVKREGETVKITAKGREVLDLAKAKVKPATENGLRIAVETAIDSLPFIKKWTEIICDEENGLPEIIYLSENIFGEQQFKKEEDVIDKIRQAGHGISKKKGREILSTLLSFGRISEIIFDKYHFFLKPISGLFLCTDCYAVNTTSECPKDPKHKEIHPLLFCKRCHAPAILGSNEELTLVSGSASDGRCECGRDVKLRNFEDVFLHYGTFTTYLLSVVSNKLEPKKILVFGDGRQLVESIANQAQDLDYSLVADRLICYLILSEGPQTLPRLRREASNLLQDIYIRKTPLDVLNRGRQISGLPSFLQSSLDTLRRSYIRTIRYQLTEPRMRLFQSAVLSFDIINKYGDPLKKAFVHALLSHITMGLFSGIGEKVGTKWFRTVGVGNIRRRLSKYSGFQCFFENNEFDTLLTEILQEYAGIEKATEIVFGNERKKLDEECIILEPNDNDLKLIVPSSVSYCETCYEGFPTAELTVCPYCLGKTNRGKRFEPASLGTSVSGKGYLENRRGVKWTLDHWAKDILSHAIAWNKNFPNPRTDRDQLVNGGIEHMVVLSHRAGIPQSIRSEIEEGFKRRIPTVNAVCATPTMELGIDIGTLNNICQVGIPPTKTNYVQRAGRTGRKMTVPSLIFTIVRNKNYVDSYFLTDLSQRFLNREISSMFIPEPSDSILLNHIFVETIQFLNTNQDETRSQYPKYYWVFPPDESLRKSLASQTVEGIFDYVLSHVFYPLSQDVLRNYNKVTSHLRKVFKPFQVDIEEYLHEIFYGWKSRLMKNIIGVFEKLSELYNETQQDRVKRGFIEKNSVLGLLIQNLNMFTEFRGIGPSIPIYDSEGELIEMKSISYALKEGYPGPYEDGEIKKGALWRIEARKFDIRKVLVKPPSLIRPPQKLMMCPNSTCDNPFETYPQDVEMCPWCSSPLEEINVYEYRYGEAKPSPSHLWSSRINTRPLFKTQIVGREDVEK